jgi:hypothetical protein
MAKKSAKKAAAKPAAEAAPSMAETGKLKQAVWHSGRMYDPKKPGDADAFAKAIASEKNADKMKDRLAKKGVISGFGTRREKPEDAADDSQEQEGENASDATEEVPEDEEQA